MFTATERAISEINNRFPVTSDRLVRVEMKGSCSLRVKVTSEEKRSEADELFSQDEVNFVIEKGQLHYFKNKKLDFFPDSQGFHKFEVVNR